MAGETTTCDGDPFADVGRDREVVAGYKAAPGVAPRILIGYAHC